MSIELEAAQGLWVTNETAGNYATDYIGVFPASFLAVPYKEGTLQRTLPQAMLDPMTGKIFADCHSVKQLGTKKGGNLSFTQALHSHGIDLNGTNALPTVTNWPAWILNRTIMGGAQASSVPGTNTVVVSATTTAITVTSGHGVRFFAGGAIGCLVNGRIEAREVKSVSGDVVTLKQALSAAPATSSIVRGAVTFFLTEDPQESLQFIQEGLEQDDRFQYRGLQGSMSFNLPMGELAEISYALTGATWGKLTAAAPQPIACTYPRFEPVACISAELTVPVVGTTTRVAVGQSAMTFEPQIAYAPVTSGMGVETIGRMKRQQARPVCKGSFTIPYEDNTWLAARDSRQSRAFNQQLGSTPGGTVLLTMPTVQVVDVQRTASGEGIAGQTVAVEARHDEDTVSNTELTRSAFRIHYL